MYRQYWEWLDRTYGVEKETFYHKQDWQLLTAIMLSAQSTDKQVEEVLPDLFECFRMERMRHSIAGSDRGKNTVDRFFSKARQKI